MLDQVHQFRVLIRKSYRDMFNKLPGSRGYVFQDQPLTIFLSSGSLQSVATDALSSSQQLAAMLHTARACSPACVTQDKT